MCELISDGSLYTGGFLSCVAFLEDGSGEGLLAYDTFWRLPLTSPEYAKVSIAQVYLFSERETGHIVEHRIDKLDSTDRASGVDRWTNMVREKKTAGRGKEGNKFYSLPEDIRGDILKRLDIKQLSRTEGVSKWWRNFIRSEMFRCTIPSHSVLYIRVGESQGYGFDFDLKEWTKLPTLRLLLSQDENLDKEYLFSSAGGLVCASIFDPLICERIVVCNPMMQKRRELPSLTFPSKPVLLHMLVDPKAKCYKVITAGSSDMAAEGHLSKKIEVFSSLTSKWEVTDGIPTCEFGLNEYQTGVCVSGFYTA